MHTNNFKIFRNNILTLSESALAEEIRLTKNRIHSQPSSKFSSLGTGHESCEYDCNGEIKMKNPI